MSLEFVPDGLNAPLERLELRAGRLSAVFEAGMVRYVRWDGVEVLRGIYAAVRDSSWGTVAPQWDLVWLERDAEHFSLELDVVYRQGELDFRARLSFEGRAGGTLLVTFTGEAHSSFLKNRIGLCVLYPMSVAGKSFELGHSEGSRESVRLPSEIVGEQPIPGFGKLHTLEHEVSAGLRARVTLEGEEFEMEDQRNWTDASFKIYGTPLSRPIPVRLEQGARVEQQVRLELLGSLGVTNLVAQPEQLIPIILTPLEQTSALPALGLCLNGRDWSDLERERLRELNLSHLRLELFLSRPLEDALERATEQARSLNLPLELALIFSDEAEVQATRLQKVLERLNPRVARWLVFHQSQHSTPEFVLNAARAHLQGYAPDAPFAGGANSDFIFINQTPPPLEHLDLLSFAVNPQVHAFDDASLMQTLEAQQSLVEHARKASGKPVVVSPVTLEPRWNPYTPSSTFSVTSLESGKTPDPRLHAAFGAAWTVGSLRALAQGGAHALSYFEALGSRGLFEGDTVYPVYAVFHRLAAFWGGQVRHTHSSDPLGAVALLLEHPERQAVLVANLGSNPSSIRLEGLFPLKVKSVQTLKRVHPSSDEVNFKPVVPNEDVLERTLGPYEVCWMALETS